MVPLQGINPTGIAVEGGIAYVVSGGFVEFFSLSDLQPSAQVTGQTLTSVVISFAQYVYANFRCTPSGMKAWKGVLYIACSGSLLAFSDHHATYDEERNSSSLNTDGFPYLVVIFSVYGRSPIRMKRINPPGLIESSFKGDFLGGVRANVMQGQNIKIYDVALYELDGEPYLLFNDAINLIVYRANLTGSL